MVGAIVVSGPTARYYVADALTVLPEQRSRGIGWTLGARVQRMANERGVGITAAIASSNAMSFADANLGPESWAAVGLHAPHRFRGQGQLRRLYGRIGRRVGRARVMLRDGDGPPPRCPDGPENANRRASRPSDLSNPVGSVSSCHRQGCRHPSTTVRPARARDSQPPASRSSLSALSDSRPPPVGRRWQESTDDPCGNQRCRCRSRRPIAATSRRARSGPSTHQRSRRRVPPSVSMAVTRPISRSASIGSSGHGLASPWNWNWLRRGRRYRWTTTVASGRQNAQISPRRGRCGARHARRAPAGIAGAIEGPATSIQRGRTETSRRSTAATALPRPALRAGSGRWLVTTSMVESPCDA